MMIRNPAVVVPPVSQVEGCATVDSVSRMRTDPLNRSWVSMPSAELDKVPRVSCKPMSSASASTSANSGTPEMTPPGASFDRSFPAGLGVNSGRWCDLVMKQDESRWSAMQTFMLSNEGGHDHIFEHVPLLDRNSVSSVSNAIDQLNEGTLSCRGGICVVFSASNGAYFLLYRHDKLDTAASMMSQPAGESRSEQLTAPRMPQVPSLPATLKLPLHRDAVRMSDKSRSLDANPSLQPPSSQGTPAVASRQPRGSSRREQAARATSRAASPCSAAGIIGSRRSSSMDISRTAAPPPAAHGAGRTPSSGCRGGSTGRGTPHRIMSTSDERHGSDCPGREAQSPKVRQASVERARERMHVRHYSLSLSDLGVLSPSSSPQLPGLARKPAAARATVGSLSHVPAIDSPSRSPLAQTPASHVRSKRASSAENRGTDDGGVEGGPVIGNLKFELLRVIGRGAFGVVWRARELSSSRDDVAVKVIVAKDSAAFATALFEAELLQILSAGIAGHARDHVPQYISHSASRSSSSSEGGTVRLAMTFVPGGALDRWVYGISDEEHKTVDVAQLVDGHLPGGQQGSWQLCGARGVVQELLSQLSGVFAALEPIAYHRDVSSHNVLILSSDHKATPMPNFALIDFGLAVRSGSWSREWRHSNLAGDPRYWTPSAWMAFAFGFKYVATHPNAGFQQQYLTRMDHFSLGILGLEVLFALWQSSEAYDGKHPGLLEARAAWCKYWVAVIQLFQMFHRYGANEVRQHLAESQHEGVTWLEGHLAQLRQALRTAARHPLNRQSATLLLVLADLVDEKGSVTWQELPSMLAEDMRADAPADGITTPAKTSSRLSKSPAPKFNHRRIRSTGVTLDQL